MNGRQVRNLTERRPDIILPWGLQAENEEGGKMIGYFSKAKRAAWIMTLLLSVTILFGMSGTTVSAAAGAVADDTTVNHWHDSIAQDDTTKNIGRIWTDKSVSAGNISVDKLNNSGTKTIEKKGDSDFLVSLSALSSAAKIMGQSTVPLDIVMVLDVSGSMDDNNKMSTLKTAVNSFIDESAKANSERSNENLRSRISLVKFSGDKIDKVGNDTYRSGYYTYNYTQVVSNYKAYTNDNKSELKNKVNALNPAGATAADYAMDQAEKQVNQSKNDEAANPDRKNVKRIVIFFTDGEPNHNTGFNENVANAAIQTAKTIKTDAPCIPSACSAMRMQASPAIPDGAAGPIRRSSMPTCTACPATIRTRPRTTIWALVPRIQTEAKQPSTRPQPRLRS